MANMREMPFTRLRRGQQDVAPMHGPQGSYVETWPQRTSRTDVGQQLPEGCRTCSHGPLITMKPSESRSATTFHKWSSWTAGRLRWTITNK